MVVLASTTRPDVTGCVGPTVTSAKPTTDAKSDQGVVTTKEAELATRNPTPIFRISLTQLVKVVGHHTAIGLEPAPFCCPECFAVALQSACDLT